MTISGEHSRPGSNATHHHALAGNRQGNDPAQKKAIERIQMRCPSPCAIFLVRNTCLSNKDSVTVARTPPGRARLAMVADRWTAIMSKCFMDTDGSTMPVSHKTAPRRSVGGRIYEFAMDTNFLDQVVPQQRTYLRRIGCSQQVDPYVFGADRVVLFFLVVLALSVAADRHRKAESADEGRAVSASRPG